MRNTKSAFTLVELIVVITILAILGTIAFISLQGYSADARNSKRTSDIGNIQSAMSLKMVEGVPIMSFIDYSNVENELSSPSIAWATTSGDEYHAGVPAYTVLNVAAKDFKDPNDKAYRIGATTLKAGAFQIAATMEVDGVPTAQVNGTYVQRLASKTYSGSIDGYTFTVGDEAANVFKVGDTISGITNATKITKVSRDGVTLTLNGTGTISWTTVALAADESKGLIMATKGTTLNVPVENLSIASLAY